MFGFGSKRSSATGGRLPMMAGNWKMNKTTAEAVQLAQAISYRFGKYWCDDVDCVLCPPLVDLKSVAGVIEFDHASLLLGAQNCYWEADGAFTGEVNPRMLKEVGCTYCIVGHSERREYFHETDEDVNRKVRALLEGDLLPIICCGESLETRDAGETLPFVTAQVRAAFEDVSAEDAAKCVIAYEPIWAIGTGHTATPEAAEEVCGAIRGLIVELYGQETADAVRILYGGSMKPENVNMFLPMPDIDGGLIGGASLDANSFITLVEACLPKRDV